MSDETTPTDMDAPGEKALVTLGRAVNAGSVPSEAFAATLRENLRAESRRAKIRKVRVWSVTALASAAAIAALALLGPWAEGPVGAVRFQEGFFIDNRDPGSVQEIARNQGMRTTEDGRAVVMVDSERVSLFLNHATTMAVPDDQMIRLTEGAVWVSVVPNSGRFTVRTPECDVIVHGTTFGVERGANGTRVTLASGRVEVASQGNMALLAPGQAATITTRGSVPQLSTIQGGVVPEWATDLYADMEEALAMRYFPSARPAPAPGTK